MGSASVLRREMRQIQPIVLDLEMEVVIELAGCVPAAQ